MIDWLWTSFFVTFLQFILDWIYQIFNGSASA